MLKYLTFVHVIVGNCFAVNIVTDRRGTVIRHTVSDVLLVI